ncbi:hypothetical protein HGRIS_007206 [Hohenbuehelia grisea]
MVLPRLASLGDYSGYVDFSPRFTRNCAHIVEQEPATSLAFERAVDGEQNDGTIWLHDSATDSAIISLCVAELVVFKHDRRCGMVYRSLSIQSHFSSFSVTMKLSAVAASLAILAHSASAHYIWNTLIAGSTTSTAAVRQPINNSPVTSVASNDARCNTTPGQASETVSVPAGSTLGFKLDNTVYHAGPAAIYLGQVPSGQTAASWDGSGANWFKIAEWGANFDPFKFTDEGASQLTTTIPSSVPAGEYLARIEQIGLHVAGSPQFYISCAQISITGGGGANPAKVSIPGYVSESDPGLTVNIYNPVPTSYTVPGPRPFTG